MIRPLLHWLRCDCRACRVISVVLAVGGMLLTFESFRAHGTAILWGLSLAFLFWSAAQPDHETRKRMGWWGRP